MEKLIRLINEYGHTSNCGPFETCRIEPATEWNSSYLVLSRDGNGEGDWKVWHLEIPRLISKEYGFIKWLVENDKIDREKFGNSETKSSKYSDFELSYNTPREDYTNILLMELAIQDEPIQFLIGMLR